jgi:hypothetical protein
MSDSTQLNNTPLPESDGTIPEAHQVSHRKLRQTLVALFDASEFRLLCHDLGINHDDLGGPDTGLSARIDALILHVNRRQRLRVLLTVVREARPALTWDQILLDENDPEPLPAIVAPRIAQADEGTADTLIASQGFNALLSLLRRPETHETIIRFQSDFQAASDRIDLMNDLKLAHDLFQELENRYFLIENDRKRLPADELAWDGLSINEPEVGAKIDDLLALAHQTTFAEEADVWARQLAKVREMMRTAVEESNLDHLNSATRLLYRIINRQPSRLNAQLIVTAKALRLQNLATAVTTICARIDESDLESSELVNRIRQDSGALAGIDARLQRLAAEHDAWQAIDDELRRVESTLDGGLEELDEAWLDLEPMTRDLIGSQTETWATDLLTLLTTLGQAIEEAVIVTARRLFRRFRSQSSRRFRQVDLELLSLCHDLQKVGESLDLVLRTVK